MELNLKGSVNFRKYNVIYFTFLLDEGSCRLNLNLQPTTFRGFSLLPFANITHMLRSCDLTLHEAKVKGYPHFLLGHIYSK